MPFRLLTAAACSDGLVPRPFQLRCCYSNSTSGWRCPLRNLSRCLIMPRWTYGPSHMLLPCPFHLSSYLFSTRFNNINKQASYSSVACLALGRESSQYYALCWLDQRWSAEPQTADHWLASELGVLDWRIELDQSASIHCGQVVIKQINKNKANQKWY